MRDAIRERLGEIQSIESELARLQGNKINLESNAAPVEELDKLFQQALTEVWR